VIQNTVIIQSPASLLKRPTSKKIIFTFIYFYRPSGCTHYTGEAAFKIVAYLLRPNEGVFISPDPIIGRPLSLSLFDLIGRLIIYLGRRTKSLKGGKAVGLGPKTKK
jgi:hypothetical protein